MESILREYDESSGDYLRLAKSIKSLAEQVAASVGIADGRVTFRVKARDSLSEKLARSDKQGKYQSLDDVTDICGVRIVVFTQEECDLIAEGIRREVVVDEGNSGDKATLTDDDRFGYRSNHIVASLTDERSALLENRGLSGLKVEIQIRTVLQDAWASLDWKLRYKSSVEVPRELRRKLFRISALLEMADESFSDLQTSALALRAQYTDKVAARDYAIPINKDSLYAFMSGSSSLTSVLDAAKRAGAQFSRDPSLTIDSAWKYLIDSILLTGIEDLGQLERAFGKVDSDGIGILKNVTDSWSGGTTSQLGIFTTLRVLLFSTFSKARRREFLDTLPTLGSAGSHERKFLLQ